MTKTKISERGYSRDGVNSTIDFMIDGVLYRYYADQAYVDRAVAMAEYKPGAALDYIKRNCTLCVKK